MKKLAPIVLFSKFVTYKKKCTISGGAGFLGSHIVHKNQWGQTRLII